MISGSIETAAENLLICDSCVNKKQEQAVPSVATCEEVRYELFDACILHCTYVLLLACDLSYQL